MIDLRRPIRRWLQFRLRTILVGMLAACVPLSMLTNKWLRTRRERAAVNSITAAGGKVWYVARDPDRKRKRYGYDVIPYDSQQRDASGLALLVAEARAGQVVAVSFGSVGDRIIRQSAWGSSDQHQMDLDGQEFGEMRGHWVLHGENDPNRRVVRTTAPQELEWRDLRMLESLELLCISERPVSDADLAYLGGLKQLRGLVLQNCDSVTNAGLGQLKELRNLRVLVIEKSQVNDDGLESLAMLEKLEVLELDHAEVHGPGLQHLAGLQELKLLSLRFCPLDDSGMGHLACLPNLQRLYFYRTRLTDAGLSDLLSLKKLELLHLGKTPVTFAGANAFEKEFGRSPIIR